MNKNPELAEAWLHERRDKIQEAKRIEREERAKRRKQKAYADKLPSLILNRFGKTKNGHWVHLGLLDFLVNAFVC
jgi:hypothetical protein